MQELFQGGVEGRETMTFPVTASESADKWYVADATIKVEVMFGGDGAGDAWGLHCTTHNWPNCEHTRALWNYLEDRPHEMKKIQDYVDRVILNDRGYFVSERPLR
jgi:hypothetical protein